MSRRLQIEVEEYPGTVVLRVTGDVCEVQEERELRDALRYHLGQAPTGALVLVDLTAAGCFSSDGCGALLSAAVYARRSERRLALQAAPQRVVRWFEIPGLTDLVTFR